MKKIILFIVFISWVFLLIHCQSVQQNQSENSEWLKQKRGGSIKSAQIDSPDFKEALSQLLVKQMSKENRTGIGFFLFNRSHRLLYAKAFGFYEDEDGEHSFSGIESLPAGSSSLWVTSILILRLVDKGRIKLSHTTGDLLDWEGKGSDITLKSLLNMTSGLPGRSHFFSCLNALTMDVQECSNEIKKSIDHNKIPVKKQGSSFSYGPSHFTLAVAMAEKATEKKWSDLVKEELVQPLNLSLNTRYYTQPVEKNGDMNPSPFDGLVISMRDYIQVLKALVSSESKYLSSPMMRQSMTLQFKQNTEILASPMKTLLEKNYSFGLGHWLECEPEISSSPTSSQSCEELNLLSCPGVFGWYPFIDINQGYYGLLAALEGHGPSEKSVEPALRSWRILKEIRQLLKDWKVN